MPAARYWRIAAIETYAGGDLELSEVALYAGATRMFGAATSTLVPVSGSLIALSDEGFGTSVRWAGEKVRLPGFAVVFDMGSSVDVTSVGAAGASMSRFAGVFGVEYSSDGVQWSLLGYVTLEYSGPTQISKSSVFRTSAFVADPHWDNVVLMLPLDGVPGSATFKDESPSPKAVSVAGTVVHTNEVTFAGKPVAKFSGGVSALLASSSDFSLGNGPFTIEGWIYLLSGDSGGFGNLTASGEIYYGTSFWIVGGGGAFRARSGRSVSGQFNDTHGVGSFPIGVWVHVAITHNGDTADPNRLKIWIDGALNASGNAQFPTNLSQFAVGRAYPTQASDGLNGYMSNVRVTRGVARYSAPFTPPEQMYAPSVLPVGFSLRTPSSPPTLIGSDVIGLAQPVPSNPPSSIDIDDAGRGRIVGTVKEKNTPANTPLKRRVVLLSMPGSRVIRETWSDPVTGVYEFTEVAMDRVYTVVSYDHTGIYRGVVADNLSPELMP